MGNIITATVKIKGTRPLFWHWFGPDAIPLEKGEKTGVAGNDPQEWRRTHTATRDGQLYLGGTYAFGTIKGGAKYIKKNRASLQGPVVATLQIVEDRILLDRYMPGFPNGHAYDPTTATVPDTDATLPVYLDIRSAVNPGTKMRNVRYRIAASPGWLATFTIQFDKTIVSREEMHSVILQAGDFIGIGNGRSIGMGRFSVEEFTVTDG